MSTFDKKIKSDIYECSRVIESRDQKEAEKLVKLIVAIYGNYINHITEGLESYIFNPEYCKMDNIDELEILKHKLELLLGNVISGNYNAKQGANVQINNTNDNKNSNINNNTIDIKVLFEDTRKEIAANSYLGEEERDEILKKIEEIEKIYKDKDSKVNKWSKLKGLMNWLSTKGVDIALKVIPLIYQSMNQS